MGLVILSTLLRYKSALGHSKRLAERMKRFTAELQALYPGSYVQAVRKRTKLAPPWAKPSHLFIVAPFGIVLMRFLLREEYNAFDATRGNDDEDMASMYWPGESEDFLVVRSFYLLPEDDEEEPDESAVVAFDRVIDYLKHLDAQASEFDDVDLTEEARKKAIEILKSSFEPSKYQTREYRLLLP